MCLYFFIFSIQFTLKILQGKKFPWKLRTLLRKVSSRRSNTLTLSGTKTETRLRNPKSITENFRARTKGAQSSGACMHTDQSPFSRNFHD